MTTPDQKELEARAMRYFARRAYTVFHNAARRAAVTWEGPEQEATERLVRFPEMTLAAMVTLLPECRPLTARLLADALQDSLDGPADAAPSEDFVLRIDNILALGDALDAFVLPLGAGAPFAQILNRSLALHEGAAEGEGPSRDYLLASEDDRLAAMAYLVASLLGWRTHGRVPQSPDPAVLEAVAPHAHRAHWVVDQMRERGARDPEEILPVLGASHNTAAEGFL